MSNFLSEFSYCYSLYVLFACFAFIFPFWLAGVMLMFFSILDFFKDLFRKVKEVLNNVH